MKRNILIVIFSLFFFLSFARGSEEKNEYTEKDYYEVLKDNTFYINFEDKKYLDKIFEKEDLNNYNIILIGENHAVSVNYILKFEFLKYFHENYNFNHLLEEIPISQAFLINLYLDSGNENILNQIKKHTYKTYFCTQEHFDFYRKLYKYNQNQQQEKRISIVGADVEHQPILAYAAMYSIIREKEDLNSLSDIKILLEKLVLKGEMDKDIYSIAQQCDKLLFDEEMGESLLGKKDFQLLKLINDNILNCKTLYGSPQNEFNKKRDKMMYDNFRILDNDKNKYFGIWGHFHVWQFQVNGLLPFASYIKANKSYSDKILSIMVQYINCMYANPQRDYEPEKIENKMFYLQASYQDKLEKDKGNLYIYKLNYKNSIFNKMNINGKKAKPGETFITDLYQYLITVKDSPACKKVDFTKHSK